MNEKFNNNKTLDFQTRINQIIEDDLISDVKYIIDNKVNFTANVTTKNIVPIIIEINKN